MEAISTLIARKLERTLSDDDLALDSTLAVDCFNIFTICIRKVRIEQGFKQLATVCAGCFCRTFYRLTATDPTSSILEDFLQRYNKALRINSTELLSYHPMIMIGALTGRNWSARPTWHGDYKPSDHEHVRFARDVAELAQAEYRREREVPEWIIDFVFDSLSLDPLPPASVIADSLKVVAICFGWDISDVAASDER